VVDKPLGTSATALDSNLAPPITPALATGMGNTTPFQTNYATPAPLGTGYSREVFVQQPLSQNIMNEPALGMAAPMTIQREYLEKPVIVRETILPEEKVSVQPVIHREREQTEFHEVMQPMKERDILPTKVVYATLPNQVTPTLVENDQQFQRSYQESTHRYIPSSEVLPTQSQTVEKAPILEEFIHKKIIEEVQPVLYKETVQPTLIEEVQPIYERVVEAPVMSEEIRSVKELGTRFPSEVTSTSGLGSTGLSGTGLSGTALSGSSSTTHYQSTKRTI